MMDAGEFYETPAWCVDRLLDEIGERLPDVGGWIEHACGMGAIMRAVDSWCINGGDPPRSWLAYDIAQPCPSTPRRSAFLLDFLEVSPPTVPISSVAISNTHFSGMQAMAAHAMKFAPIVIQLGRLSWLGSTARNAWLREHPPSLYPIPDRPSFRGNGSTDSACYGWFVWGLDPVPVLRVLDCTPLGVRKAEYANHGPLKPGLAGISGES